MCMAWHGSTRGQEVRKGFVARLPHILLTMGVSCRLLCMGSGHFVLEGVALVLCGEIYRNQRRVSDDRFYRVNSIYFTALS